MFYYLGASLGSFYLEPFWQWAAWPGVVLASLNESIENIREWIASNHPLQAAEFDRKYPNGKEWKCWVLAT